eukprot:2409731-Rhodomonas_salina.3
MTLRDPGAAIAAHAQGLDDPDLQPGGDVGRAHGLLAHRARGQAPWEVPRRHPPGPPALLTRARRRIQRCLFVVDGVGGAGDGGDEDEVVVEDGD